MGAFEVEGSTADILNDFLFKHEELNERFGKAETVFEPRVISGYSCGVKKLFGDRFVLTGNSTEFLDPVFSSGVTFALETGVRAGELIAKELNGEVVNWYEDFESFIKRGVDVFRTYVTGWYDGTLQRIFFTDLLNQRIKNQICSVLAGYVWDESNPYVAKHQRGLKALEKVIAYEEKKRKSH